MLDPNFAPAQQALDSLPDPKKPRGLFGKIFGR
jgi:hypothetical protein